MSPYVNMFVKIRPIFHKCLYVECFWNLISYFIKIMVLIQSHILDSRVSYLVLQKKKYIVPESVILFMCCYVYIYIFV